MIISNFWGRVGLAVILTCGLPAFAASLPMADDLAAAGREARELRVPILVVFTLRTCPYCAAAKRDYLEPMHASAQWRRKVIVREIEVDSRQPMRDFAGQPTTQREFAGKQEVKRVPTVIVFDDEGKRAATPIVGLMSSDFYGLYLEQSIDAGLTRVRSATH
jgi:thioredoxin-related protein